MEAYNKQLTTIITLTGAAMLPTLNQKTSSDTSSGETVDALLMRCLPRPTARSVFTGDVVAFTSPLAQQQQHSVLVRRVAASEGDEMVSDDADDVPFSLPEGALQSLPSCICYTYFAALPSRFGHTFPTCWQQSNLMPSGMLRCCH